MTDEPQLDPNDPPEVDAPVDPVAALEVPVEDLPTRTQPLDVSSRDLVLEMRGIGKSFPGVRALEGVNLTVRAGEVHALLGENGAGKSTLIKILSGAYTRDEGEILFEGRPVDIKSPSDAERLGISTIYQEFNLGKSLTVAENIFLGLSLIHI